MLAQIRGLTIDDASKKIRKKLAKELERVGEIEHLFAYDIEWNKKEEGWRSKLEEFIEDRSRGSSVRSRAQYVDLNEKPSKFFLNLEKKFV